MKRNSKNSGFTLIELLAVIVILMILMGLIMAVVRDALKDATLNRARSEAWEIHNAVQAFFHEYGTLPLPVQAHHGKSTSFFGDEKWYGTGESGEEDLTKIYEILRAIDSSLNPRGIVFLRRVARTEPEHEEPPLRDPWGQPYLIAMDSTYDGQVRPPSHYEARYDTPGHAAWRGVIDIEGVVSVRSMGPNQQADASGVGRGFDDIITGFEP